MNVHLSYFNLFLTPLSIIYGRKIIPPANVMPSLMPKWAFGFHSVLSWMIFITLVYLKVKKEKKRKRTAPYLLHLPENHPFVEELCSEARKEKSKKTGFSNGISRLAFSFALMPNLMSCYTISENLSTCQPMTDVCSIFAFMTRQYWKTILTV